MKKILLTGANGQLGRSLRPLLEAAPETETTFIDIDDLDITNREAVARFMRDADYDFIINCAAYTAVDKAEKSELAASAINTAAVGILGEHARRIGAKMIHISTDYVFSGENFRPYNEHDEPFPRSIYGRTKLEGEGVLAAFCPDSVIIRTAWLYSEFGENFLSTMLDKMSRNEEIKVVADQIGTPTYARDLAATILSIIGAEKWTPGIYHFTNEGVASWYDFAMAIKRLSGSHSTVIPVSTSEYPVAAHRPPYSVLNKSKIKKTYGIHPRYWQEALEECVGNMRDVQL